MTPELEAILNHVPAFLLVLFRISGIFILAPVLGSATIPTQVKVLLTLTLSLCVYPLLLDTGKPSSGFIAHATSQGLVMWTIPVLIGLELLVGYTIGFAVSIPLMGMQVGGSIIGQQVGVGAAALFNPDTQAESDPVAELFFFVALAIFTILGGHRVMLETLVGSFDRIPLGGFNDFAAIAGLVVGLATLMIELALRIAAPMLCLIFLETIAMGFISRTVPGMNIMSIGFALRLVMGMGFLVMSIGLAATVYTDVTRQVLYAIRNFFTLGAA